MLKRKPQWPLLIQLVTGGILTGVIALVLKARGKTLATNAIYPPSSYIKNTLTDGTLDQLWKLDLEYRDGLISSAEYARKKSLLLDQPVQPDQPDRP